METMKTIEIIRVDKSIEGVFGVLTIESRVFCVTLERPWVGNARGLSCIPDGTYVCRQKKSDQFGLTYEVVDVPERSDILFHWGNTAGDTLGCIILGRYYGFVESKRMRGILASKATFTNFMNILRHDDEFKLIVRSA